MPPTAVTQLLHLVGMAEKSGIRVLSKDEDTRVSFEAKALGEGLDGGF